MGGLPEWSEGSGSRLMRRNDREIRDFNEILEIIRTCDVCRIAFNDEGFPYIVPLNFGAEVRGEQVYFYFHGAMKGKKLDLIAKDNRAAFEMDCDHRIVLDKEQRGCSCTMGYASVMGHGTIEIVPEEEKEDALRILMRQYHGEAFSFHKDVLKHTVVLKMTVLDMTGKRNRIS